MYFSGLSKTAFVRGPVDHYGVPAIAVGLSAVSFLAMLAKDAASIPNAGGAAETAGGPYIN